ncbi:putative protein LAZY1 [Helianthus annuus]|nr:putative protein LAZY1 [Helianthus annuus]
MLCGTYMQILQMFHRKVHPEGVAVEPKSENHLKHATEGNFVQEYKNKNQKLFEDDKLFPMVDGSKKGANCTISHMPSDCCITDSDGNRECWINSDADCKHANIHQNTQTHTHTHTHTYIYIYMYIYRGACISEP